MEYVPDTATSNETETNKSDRKEIIFSTNCRSEEDHKLLNNLCNNPVIFDQFKIWMEQMKVSAIMKLQTELSKLAPEFEITPKGKKNPKTH